jgi:hypothetical protein
MGFCLKPFCLRAKIINEDGPLFVDAFLDCLLLGSPVAPPPVGTLLSDEPRSSQSPLATPESFLELYERGEIRLVYTAKYIQDLADDIKSNAEQSSPFIRRLREALLRRPMARISTKDVPGLMAGLASNKSCRLGSLIIRCLVITVPALRYPRLQLLRKQTFRAQPQRSARRQHWDAQLRGHPRQLRRAHDGSELPSLGLHRAAHKVKLAKSYQASNWHCYELVSQ